MESGKGDRRVRYSHRVIRQAFLELLLQEPINKVTVKEICERADVNRGTFYAYYRDPYDLMQKMEDDLIADVERALDRMDTRGAGKGMSGTYGVVLELMEFIRQNADLCRVMLSGSAGGSFVNRVSRQARIAFTREWSNRIDTGRKETLDYLYTFSVSGSISVVQQWLQSGMKETPRQIATIVERAVYQGIGAFAEPASK